MLSVVFLCLLNFFGCTRSAITAWSSTNFYLVYSTTNYSRRYFFKLTIAKTCLQKADDIQQNTQLGKHILHYSSEESELESLYGNNYNSKLGAAWIGLYWDPLRWLWEDGTTNNYMNGIYGPPLPGDTCAIFVKCLCYVYAVFTQKVALIYALRSKIANLQSNQATDDQEPNEKPDEKSNEKSNKKPDKKPDKTRQNPTKNPSCSCFEERERGKTIAIALQIRLLQIQTIKLI
ncbi:hypothetical protein RFI_00024 [Reticulomyxa filosa]|uniref:C-type lectin domain-containing protein n=1 Tax=Reticulomyxa filosa TaxID=46433 RepID=X6PG85_RETFI|nr:hypothetical protein RFI_00024 [Reticulomyxa filosa]|eukprot:ETO37039.1 hypothetical protein RFI_00024 [Reticulomyxa filosa]